MNNINNKEKINNINKLLAKYDNNWEELLYCSYYQVASPYHVLYVPDLISYLEQGKKEEIDELKGMVDIKTFESIFNSAIEKINKTDSMDKWKNIVDYYIYSKNDNLLKVIDICNLYPSDKVEYVKDIGVTFSDLYNKFTQDKDILTLIDSYFNKKYENVEITNIENEYIKCYDKVNDKNTFLEKIHISNYSQDLPNKLIKDKEFKDAKNILLYNKFNFLSDNIKNVIDSIQSNIISEDKNNGFVSNIHLVKFYIFYNNSIDQNIINFFNTIDGDYYKTSKNLQYIELLSFFYYIIDDFDNDFYSNVKSKIVSITHKIYTIKYDYKTYIYSILILLKLDMSISEIVFDSKLFDEYVSKYNDIDNNYKLLELIKYCNVYDNSHFKNFINNLYEYIMSNIKSIVGIEKYILKKLSIDIIYCQNLNNDFNNFIFNNDKNLLKDYINKICDNKNENNLLSILNQFCIDSLDANIFNIVLNYFKNKNKGKEIELFKKVPDNLFKLLITNHENYKCNFDNFDFHNRILEAINLLDKSKIYDYVDNITLIFSEEALKDINSKLNDINVNITNFNSADTLIKFVEILKILNSQRLNISAAIKYSIKEIDSNVIDSKYMELFKLFDGIKDNLNFEYKNILINNKDVFKKLYDDKKINDEEIKNIIKNIIKLKK
ncbi:hypothetical protein R4K55_01110 [Brachyspira alvinipulli]|uniref:hypothetical protein n=1 Tax=Brachyspira alvinipulli TaxID=84379 RepID=UPI0030069F3C